MKELRILIPVYNKLEYTKKCLHDLKVNLTGILTDFAQIVVIDDGSGDGTGKWIHHNHPEVVVLQGTGNLFWTGAVNVGIKYAVHQQGHEYILLWNNDVIAGKDYFHNLLKIIQTATEGIVGSKIMTLHDKNIIWSFGGYFNPRTGSKIGLGNFHPDGVAYAAITSVDWCTGMGTLIPRKIIDKIGLMDEQLFPQYFGDADYCYRAKLAGFPVRVHPDLILFNDTANTGIRGRNGITDLINSLTDIRSNLNFKTNYTFIKKHATSHWAYFSLLTFYFKVIGGFVKWKLLALIGLHRGSDRFFAKSHGIRMSGSIRHTL